MKKRYLWMLALGSALFVLPNSSQAETLHVAVMKALEEHPTIEAARAVEKRISEERREERSGLFPEISANASGGRIFSDNSTSRGLVVERGAAYSYLWEGSATLTQPIFDGMEVFNRVDAADARLAAQNYTVSDVRENLGLRAAQAYLNVMRAREALFNIENYRDTLKAYLDRIELMVNEGAADEAEAAQARNIQLLLEDSLIEFQGQVDTAEAEYIEIVGQMPETDLQEPAIGNGTGFGSVDEAVEYAKRNHPTLNAARKELEAAAFDVEAEEGTLFPDLDGELSYTKRDQDDEIGGELEDKRALLRMSWNFSTGGGELARIRQRKADYSEALANLQTAEREMVGEVRRAFSAYDTVRRQNELVEKREKITSDLFETYKIQFEGARVSLLQLMQTENQMFNTKLEAVNTHYQYLAGYFGLLASMGDLLKSMNVGHTVEPFTYPESDPENERAIEKMVEVPVVVETDEPQVFEAIAPAQQELKNAPVYPKADYQPVKEDTPAKAVSINDPQTPQIFEPAPSVFEAEPQIFEPKDKGIWDAPAAPARSGPAPKEQIYPLEDY